jgi:predicted signal transduction protein with EAL and GGDEF domain
VIGRGIHDDEDVASLFRVSGDEFSVLCPHSAHPENTIKIASRIIDIMQHPFDADGTAVYISPGIGIATYPTDAMDVATLVQCAVGASAQITASEQGGFEFYSSELNARSCERLQLEADLRQAIMEDNQLVLYYQPKVSVRSGQITGVEALIRWRKPDGRFIFPDSFIPLAEETGLSGPWVNGCSERLALNWHVGKPKGCGFKLR